jgi:translocation and assembly module TamB
VATVRVEAFDSTRRVLDAAGTVPVNLALRPQGSRFVESPVDVRVSADSLDLGVALGYLPFLTEVDGVVSGEFFIGGSLEEPEPSGVVRISEGAWSLDLLGVRHTSVEGTLALQPDGRVEVSLAAQAAAAAGSSTVSGEVNLNPLRDAGLALTIAFQNFEVVNRLDVQGRVSGEVRLGGTYQRPLLEGSLSVNQGTLYLEEFARSAEIVDLTDPRIFDVVDTTALSSRPLIAGIRNPFLQSLRVNVDLAVPRDTWLRSEDANVEIGGNLTVSYDRQSRDIVMVGDLQALRGQYTVLGRRFDVSEGTVSFIGTPGINPSLNIQAVSRLRRVGGDPLEVIATVTGNLTQPRVILSTDEQGIAESDLVSYLIFGRPSSELATGQSALLQGATEAGVTLLSGALSTQLGAAVAQRIGVDYLSITQAGDFSSGLDPALAGTQVEIGQYLRDDVFIVFILRPLAGQASTGTDFFGGARLEIALSDNYNVQAFWEDRFLRGRVGGFGELGVQASEVVGVFIFRERGY